MKLSIITINRNNAEGLRKTMESVLSQTYRDFEYIIVDGASTDDSVDIIKSMVPELNMDINGISVRWISEPDTGIYNAMNKGIRMSNGEYSLMLNSGDYFVDNDVLQKVLVELDGTDIIQGNVIIDKNGKLRVCRGYGKSDISFFEALDANFLHQASFISRRCYDKYGYYDDSYKKCADSYFYIKALALQNASFRYVDITIANFDTSGISSMVDPKWRQIDKEEDARFFPENLSKRMMMEWKESPKKIALYDLLHSHPLLWKCTMFLKILATSIEKIQCKQKS